MNKLIKVELFKIFRRKSIYVIIGFIILVCFCVCYLYNGKEKLNYNDNYNVIDALDKKEYLKISENNNYKNYLYQVNVYNNNVRDNIRIYNYYKEKNIDLNKKPKYILEKSFIILTFISIIISILGCSLVSNEINKKSVKELITKPYKRWKFIASKSFVLLLLIILLVIVVVLSMSIFTALLTKINIFTLKEFVVKNNVITEVYYYLNFIKKVAINLISLAFTGSLSIFLSTIILNSSISSGILIFLGISSSLLFQLLLKFGFNPVVYTFLPYLDMNYIFNKSELFSINASFGINIDLKIGIIVLIIYTLIFFILSNIIFIKKDIVNE